MVSESTKLWLSEPPQWPPICGEFASSSHNLNQYLRCDKEDDNNKLGSLYSVGEFLFFCQNLQAGLGSVNQEVDTSKIGRNEVRNSEKYHEIKEPS
jgi:hypothetical protein